MTHKTVLHTARGHLEPVAPFNFEESLAFLGLFTPTSGEQVLDYLRAWA